MLRILEAQFVAISLTDFRVLNTCSFAISKVFCWMCFKADSWRCSAAGKVAIRLDFSCPRWGKRLSWRIEPADWVDDAFPVGFVLSTESAVLLRTDLCCWLSRQCFSCRICTVDWVGGGYRGGLEVATKYAPQRKSADSASTDGTT